MKHLFLLVLLASFTLVFGQEEDNGNFDFDVLVGETTKSSKKNLLKYIIGSDETGVYVRRQNVKWTSKKGEYIIAKYNTKLELEKTSIHNAEYKGNRLEIERIMLFNDEIVVFYSYYNKKKNKRYLFYETINKETLRTSNEMEMIAEFEEEKTFFFSGYASVITSDDNSKLAVIFMLPHKKRKNEQYRIKIFNNEMEMMWEKDVRLPYDSKRFMVERYMVDNNGNFYLLGSLFKTSRIKFKREGKPNYNYHLLTYLDNGDNVEDHKIRLKNKFITDLQVGVNESGNVICSGFYSGEGDFSIKGTFFLTIDKERGEVLTEKYKAFNKDFLMEFLSERQKKKAKKKKKKVVGLRDYDLREIVVTNDGGAVLIGEQFYVYVTYTTTSTGSGGSTTTTTTHYIYNDIIVIYIDKNGEILWNVRIPKQQHSTNDGGYYLSYALNITENNLYFAFNDFSYGNPNKDKWCTCTPCAIFGGKYKYGGMAIYQVTADGVSTRKTTISARKQHMTPVPKISTDQYSSDLIMMGKGKKVDNLIRIRFAE